MQNMANVGKIDRMFRLIFGVIFVLGGLIYLANPVSYIVAFVGLVLIVTGLRGQCAVYSVLGINTCGSPYCDVPEPEPAVEPRPVPLSKQEPFEFELPREEAPPAKKKAKPKKKAKKKPKAKKKSSKKGSKKKR